MSLSAAITGVGVWGPGMCSVDDLLLIISDDAMSAVDPSTDTRVTATPKPAAIPPRERRRSPISVKLAVEVASQACAQAKIKTSEPACVFASGMGDTDITDYLCRLLAGPDKLVSPTKFHNSVHNAPAGYWTISTECQQAATSVAAFTYSFPVALMEAVVQIVCESRPVLLVLDDIATPTPMQDINPIHDGFAVALLLQPPHTAQDALAQICLTVSDTVDHWPALSTKALEPLYTSNPAARSLALLETLARPHTPSATLHYPLSPSSTCQLKIAPLRALHSVSPLMETAHAT